jgi:hypothetical protein
VDAVALPFAALALVELGQVFRRRVGFAQERGGDRETRGGGEWGTGSGRIEI